ncbi:MAG: glycosyltransferase family 2 protein [Planctomycetota bacterium]|jgi:glycosyltransferase involved in cell wall biosynthesis
MAIPGPKALVIIPARNEQGRVGAVVRSARAALPDADIAVIDDNSQDGTAKEAAYAGAVILRHTINLGYGAGLETGYVYAVRKGYDCVLQMDGDGQHPGEELPKLLAPVLSGEADLVVGSRHLEGSYRMPPLRRFGQKVFGAIVRLLTGLEITDVTSGFQCLGKRALGFFSSGVFPTDYPDADVLIMAHFAGLRVSEVPVRMIVRAEDVPFDIRRTLELQEMETLCTQDR